MVQPTSDQPMHLHAALRWFSQNYLPDEYDFVYKRLPAVRQIPGMQRINADAKELLDFFQSWSLNH